MCCYNDQSNRDQTKARQSWVFHLVCSMMRLWVWCEFILTFSNLHATFINLQCHSCIAGTLSANQDDMFCGMGIDNSKLWMQVIDEKGEIGFLPTNYMEFCNWVSIINLNGYFPHRSSYSDKQPTPNISPSDSLLRPIGQHNIEFRSVSTCRRLILYSYEHNKMNNHRTPQVFALRCELWTVHWWNERSQYAYFFDGVRSVITEAPQLSTQWIR